MVSDEPQHVDLDTFREQHEHLRHVLAELDAAVVERQGSGSSIAASLRKLRDFMQAHIVIEEADGYFHEALAHAPRLKTWADNLRRDHPQLLVLANQLISCVESEDGAESWWLKVGALYEEFARRLREHEQNENQLLQEAYTQDTGAGD